MEKKTEKFPYSKKLFEQNKNLYFYAGLSIWNTSSWYKIYFKFGLIVAAMLLFFELCGLLLFLMSGNIEEAINISGILFIHILGMHRHHVLITHHKEFTEIMDALDENEFKMKKQYSIQLTNRAKRMNEFTNKSIIILAIITISTRLISPLFDEKFTYRFPVTIWVPLDFQKYHIACFYFAFGMVSIAFVIISCMVVYFVLLMKGIMIFIACQFSIISASLERIVEDNEEIINEPEDTVYKKEKILQNKIMLSLEEHILQHQAIIRYSTLMRKLSSNCMLTQVLVSGTIISLSAYELTQLELTNYVRLVTVVGYFSYTFIELFLLCTFGEDVATQSAKVAIAAYSNQWYRMTSLSNRKHLMILTIRAQRPIEMTAGNMFTLSHGQYMGVVKFSYSVLMLLLRKSSHKSNLKL